ncbi:MAG TPA: Flp pilus assembly protein CpaB [Bordetella sp.]
MSRVTAQIAAVLLIVIAVVLGVLAWRLSQRPPAPPAPVVIASTRNEPSRPTVPVVTAAKPIASGSRIEAGALTVEQWPMRPAQGHATLEGLVGQYVRLDISQGQPITDALLVKGLSTHLKPGERAVTIPVDEVSGVQNRVQPGDTVDLFYVVERGSEVPGSQTRLLQARVPVLAYGMQSVDGAPPTEDNGKPSASRNNAPPPAPRNAVLAVPVEKVNELLLAARSGRLMMALRSPQDTDVPDPTLFTPRQAVLIARPDLTQEQKDHLKDPINSAYAGDDLPQLAGPATPKPDAQPKPKPIKPRGKGAGGSIEVLRGSETQTVHY